MSLNQILFSPPIRANNGKTPVTQTADIRRRGSIPDYSNRTKPIQDRVSITRHPTDLKPEQTEEKRGFSLWDLVDIVNPLQHVPILGSIYRATTGDEIKAPARILGGGLFGGVLGALSGLANAALKAITGRDVGGHVLSLIAGKNPGRQ